MIKFIFTVCFFFTCVVQVAYAVSSDFRVQFQMGIDTTPPSTPPSLVALPISSTQIDLLWGASTDNALLGGYQVFRNFLQVATTTLTTYSDSGLTASTSYTYYIKAFDSSFNLSSSSNIMTTSTLPFVPVATTTPSTTPQSGSSSSSGPLELLSFSIVPTQQSVQMAWKTSRYVQFELRWGRTASYELGFVSNELYKKDHSTSIDDLQPGTTYEFMIIAYSKDGRRTILKESQFKTLDAPDTSAPTNVSNLRALVSGDDVLLTWNAPQDTDFSHVRIVRSQLFYPNDPADGFITYEGSATSLRDRSALLKNKKQYYTVFSYDTHGNISSGAVVSVESGDTSSPIETKPVIATSTSTASSSEIALLFTDFEFIQNNQRVGKDDLDALLPFTVRIAYAKLPEHLKTITITFRHPYDSESTFSFLLRINKDKTFYEASIAPLQTEGKYPTAVAVFDHQTQKLFSLEDVLQVYKKPTYALQVEPSETSIVPQVLKIAVLIFLLFLLWLLVFYRFFRKAKTENG